MPKISEITVPDCYKQALGLLSDTRGGLDCLPRDEFLAGKPRGRALIFPAIDDLAFLAAGQKFENNFLAAIQSGPAMILVGGKDEPMPFQNLIRAALGKDRIAAVRIHFDRWRFAAMRLSRNLNADAIVGS